MTDKEKAIAYDNLVHIARTLMASKGMPSLVINAPEDSDDDWRVYPSGQMMIGKGQTLADAAAHAMNHPQIPAMYGDTQ